MVDQLVELFTATRPRKVLTHNPCDRHATHVAITLAVVEACRALPEADRPEQVLGIEVWRGLDWLADSGRVTVEVVADEGLLEAALDAHASQSATKPYGAGTTSRHRANAVFDESHESSTADRVAHAVDLTPLVADPTLDVVEFVDGLVARFRQELTATLRNLQ